MTVMKKKKVVKNKVSFSFAIILISLFLFGVILYRGYTLAMSKEIDGINLSEFVKKRNIISLYRLISFRNSFNVL